MSRRKTNKLSANDTQQGGNHYKTMRFQPWVVMEDWMPVLARIAYHYGDALSYLGRFYLKGHVGKGGVLEVKKAIHHLQKLVEIMEENNLQHPTEEEETTKHDKE